MNWWQRLFNSQRLEQELDKELRFHFEQQVAANIRTGMTEEQARRATRLAFGGLNQVKEDCRESRGTLWVTSVVQDLRFTLRTLRRDRAFTIVAVLILALGIGANIAVFSVVDTILLRPLPFHDARRLVWIAGNNGIGALSDTTFRVDAYEEIQRHNQSLQDMTAYVPFFASSDAKMTGSGEPRVLAGVWVASNFFPMLGIQPQLGRLFTPEETVKGGRPAVLLSYPFWQRQFAGDPAIVGHAITLNHHAVTVVGVLPASFDFGSVFHPGVKADIVTPVIMDDIRTWGHMLSIIGQLKPGVTVAQAQAEANVVYPQIRAAHPEWMTDLTIKMSGLKEHVSGQLRRSLVVLWCAVGLILLIACANLSNLLLARAAARSKEFAMRSALGAGRSRLIRQLLTESLVLASMGAALGLAIAYRHHPLSFPPGIHCASLAEQRAHRRPCARLDAPHRLRRHRLLRCRSHSQDVRRQPAGISERRRPRHAVPAESMIGCARPWWSPRSPWPACCWSAPVCCCAVSCACSTSISDSSPATPTR